MATRKKTGEDTCYFGCGRLGLALLPLSRADAAGLRPLSMEPDCALKVAARFGDGRETFVASPSSINPRMVNHAKSNSHQWWPCLAEVGAA